MPTSQVLAAQGVKSHWNGNERRMTGAGASLRGVCPALRPALKLHAIEAQREDLETAADAIQAELKADLE